MIPVHYPRPDFKINSEAGKKFIFDSLRKKWIVMTPEEWVRQNFVQYLLQEKKYPVSLIALEKEIQLGELRKRFDILVYDTKYQPWMLVECKATNVPLNDAVLEQVLRYNASVPVHYLILTNGTSCIGFLKEKGKLSMINQFPDHEK